MKGENNGKWMDLYPLHDTFLYPMMGIAMEVEPFPVVHLALLWLEFRRRQPHTMVNVWRRPHVVFIFMVQSAQTNN